MAEQLFPLIGTRQYPPDMAGVLTRHALTKDLYKNGRKACWSQRESVVESALLAAQALAQSGVLPHPENSHDIVRLLSPSANKGYAERRLQELLSSQYNVIAGDIAFPPDTDCSIQFDASFLPFYHSIDVIFDRAGVAFYETFADFKNTARVNGISMNIQMLFKSYRETLTDRGMVIVDDYPSPNNNKNSTGYMIDRVVPAMIFPGFRPHFSIGEGLQKMRVYPVLPEKDTA